LKEHVLALKPTVIVLGYGGNEAFDGKAGLPRFKEGLRRLLDALAPAKARLVFLAPPRQENLGPPLPDPTKHNEDLRLYGDVLRAAADEHKGWFVDLYELLGDEAKLPLTDDGLHLTAYGYWRAAAALEQGLGLRPVRWQVAVTADGSAKEATGAAKVEALDNALRFRITDLRLPALQAPADAPKGAQTTEGERVLHVRGLAAGDYLLKIDGKTASRATAAEETGFPIQHGPEADQAERLRKAIVAKNRLYFHRWRPQNETYLFGFRKQEQGQNAHEIPEFDPFVEKAEKEIAALARPEAHVYELVKGEK
jgi:hypothetical protein